MDGTNGIEFKRDGDKLVITVNLKQTLTGRLSTGRPGSHGEARGDIDGKPFRVGLNVMAAGKVQAIAQV